MEDMESYVAAAAAAVSSFDMEIRSMRLQHATSLAGHAGVEEAAGGGGGRSGQRDGGGGGRKAGERVWAVVNTTSDGLTQLATLHSAEEIAFVKRVIDAMFEKYNTPRIEALCLDSMQANKLRIPPPPSEDTTMVDDNDEDEDGTTQQQQQPTQTLKGLKSSEAEAVMHSMVDEGWFEKTREGLYMLSSRALLELRSWLVEAYNDPDAAEGEWRRVKHCEACREIVTVGKRCPERDCHMRLHEICDDAFWRTRRDRACPKCKTTWPRGEEHRSFVGPKAITETEAYQRGRRRSGKARNSNLVEQIMHEDEEDEDPEGDDDEE
ncbi:Nse1 non-SMC component of SMC5-6 complex-domain-containing protein, partial [Microdochium trichocladiopsis]